LLRIGRLVAACACAAVALGACARHDAGGARSAKGWYPRVPLSRAERAYLDSLPPLRIGVPPHWSPMAFVDAQGHIDGISADYLDFLRDGLRLRFSVVPTHSWAETIRLANAGRIDIVVAASQFDGLAPGFGLSTAYVRYPLVIVTRETAPFIGGIEDLEGAQVAVIGDVQTSRVRLAGLPNLHTVTVGSADEGLKAVAQGRAFAYIGNLGVVDRIVRERYAGTLRVAAPAERTQDLSFAVAPGFAPLLPLVDRVLAAVPETEREYIQNSWLSTRFTFGVAPRTLWLVLAPIGTLTLLFLCVLWFNVHRLRDEVRQRRRTERELVSAARARELLIATVSHEIRTPMSGIVSILQLLDHDGLTRDDRELVGMAGNAAESLLLILNDILDHAKSENGELSLEHAPMSLEQIAAHAVGLVMPELERKGVAMRVYISRAVARHHMGDARRLGQVLLNLLGNAAKFTDRGDVSLTLDVVSDSGDRQVLSIRVADTGIGIGVEDQARLFAPFSRARALASGYGGTGLGLAICKRLIEQMGGTIALESELGCGTTVTVTLELFVERRAARQCAADPVGSHAPAMAAGAAANAAGAPRLLLVEDHAINREVLRRQLASLGVADCDLAENGAQALSACERMDYAMIISDCAMPELGGAELIARMRQREHGRAHRTVLIALTADATQRQRAACIEAGADEVCVKPLPLERLRELLERYAPAVVARRPSASAAAPIKRNDDLWRELQRMLVAEMDVLLGLSLGEDKDRARDIAHSIAGSAAWFQLSDVGRAAAHFEQALEEDGDARAALQVLKASIERAIDEAGAHRLH
jgi:signal transduction histidine kinase/DNA-binding NarL/FixJ family response regulator